LPNICTVVVFNHDRTVVHTGTCKTHTHTQNICQHSCMLVSECICLPSRELPLSKCAIH
jgi:hypothetical protein